MLKWFIMHILWSSRNYSSTFSLRTRQQVMHGRWHVAAWTVVYCIARRAAGSLPPSWMLCLAEREITSVHCLQHFNAFESRAENSHICTVGWISTESSEPGREQRQEGEEEEGGRSWGVIEMYQAESNVRRYQRTGRKKKTRGSGSITLYYLHC